jgi:glycine/D-amino acid oxidase-like deaminating enzyme
MGLRNQGRGLPGAMIWFSAIGRLVLISVLICIDIVPMMPHVRRVSGCSGHGFKFTVLLGKIAAESTTLGITPPYFAYFTMNWFGT